MWARVQQALPDRGAGAIASGRGVSGPADRRPWRQSSSRSWRWRSRTRPALPAATTAGVSEIAAPLAASGAPESRTRERVLLTALDGHFEQTELLLTELLNAPEDAGERIRVRAHDRRRPGGVRPAVSDHRRAEWQAASGQHARRARTAARGSRAQPGKSQSQGSQVSSLADRRRGPALQGARRHERNPRASTGNHHDTRGQLYETSGFVRSDRRMAVGRGRTVGASNASCSPGAGARARRGARATNPAGGPRPAAGHGAGLRRRAGHSRGSDGRP